VCLIFGRGVALEGQVLAALFLIGNLDVDGFFEARGRILKGDLRTLGRSTIHEDCVLRVAARISVCIKQQSAFENLMLELLSEGTAAAIAQVRLFALALDFLVRRRCH